MANKNIKYHSLREVADLLSCSVSQVYNYIAADRIVAGNLDGKTLVSDEEIARFQSSLPRMIEIATILLLASMGYALKLLKEKAGIDMKASRRDALQVALTDAAGKLVAHLGSGALAAGLDAASPGGADAVSYVAEAAPDAVRHFGLTESQIAEKVVAKLGMLASPAPAR